MMWILVAIWLLWPTESHAINVCQANAAAPSLTEGTQVPCSVDLSGNLRTSGGGGGGTTNVTQFGSNNVVTGTGASGLGIPRMTVSNDSNILATQSGTWTMQPGNTANTTPWLTTDSADGNTGAAVPTKAGYIGGNGSGNLTGVTLCDQVATANITANTQIITGAASKQTYICSINVGPIGTATNVALVEGTGSVCATGIAGMSGGTTAATGWNFGANGGITQGTGMGWIAKTATVADNICLLVSAANNVNYRITYTQY